MQIDLTHIWGVQPIFNEVLTNGVVKFQAATSFHVLALLVALEMHPQIL
jgi:hypothetical protein